MVDLSKFNRPKVDDITAFLGRQISAEEYALRCRVRTCRNAAGFQATRASSPNARAIYWMVSEMASAWVYRAALPHELEQVKDHLEMLLECAWSAEEIHVNLEEAA